MAIERQLMQTLKDELMREKDGLLKVKENTTRVTNKMKKFIIRYLALASLLNSSQVRLIYYNLYIQDASSCHEPALNGLDGASRNEEDQEVVSGKKKKQNIEQNYLDPIKVVNENFNKHKCLQFLKRSNLPKPTLNELGDAPSNQQQHIQHQQNAMNEKLKKQKDVLFFKASKLDKPTLNVSGNAPSFKEPQKKDITHYLMSNHQIKAGTRVNIFCHKIPKKIVGHGIVVGIICSEEGEKPTHVKVYVEEILTPNAKLLMPYEGAKTIGKVVHKCIDWELANIMEM
ncbi:hypothetical protein CDL12_20994 [Handroanthus impetiginosus]|uniref:Transposase Tnp1/En/Spm-like domain-containing protein n=1 Tax=Handroanthus impetiginosus TaxID=429701 RepID=A0A2G9GMF9_9LAMI|nr:hypothetical protein CDL12_20994 [Handroanthus impetiginosus]